MRLVPSRAVLARSAFVVASLGLAVFSLRAPTWAATLAAQGYYADFVLSMTTPQPAVAAGSRFAADARVIGLGPDTARQAVLNYRGDVDLRLVESAICDAIGALALRCVLPEIAPDAHIDQRIWSDSNPDARGFRLISAFITSELLPTPGNPGLEVDAVAVELRGEHATGISLVEERPRVDADLRLTWTFVIDNLGPSSLLRGRLELIADPGTELSCRSTGNARCEGGSGEPLYAPVDGQLAIDVTVPSIEPRVAATFVSLRLIREEGLDVGGRPSVASAAFAFSIFRDSFGD